MSLKRKLIQGIDDDRLEYKKFSDTLGILISVIVFVAISLSLVFSRQEALSCHVEIKYGNVLLYDLNDPTKNTNIQFPEEGKKDITYRREDGEIFLGKGNYFNFYGPLVTITLYSSKAIEITEEDSPRNICSNLGKIDGINIPLVCLPNNIQAEIVADTFPEWD